MPVCRVFCQNDLVYSVPSSRERIPPVDYKHKQVNIYHEKNTCDDNMARGWRREFAFL